MGRRGSGLLGPLGRGVRGSDGCRLLPLSPSCFEPARSNRGGAPQEGEAARTRESKGVPPKHYTGAELEAFRAEYYDRKRRAAEGGVEPVARAPRALLELSGEKILKTRNWVTAKRKGERKGRGR